MTFDRLPPSAENSFQENWTCPFLVNGSCSAVESTWKLDPDRQLHVCQFPWKKTKTETYPRCGIFFLNKHFKKILLDLRRKEDFDRFPDLAKLGAEDTLNQVCRYMEGVCERCTSCAKVVSSPRICRYHRRRLMKITYLLQEANGFNTEAGLQFSAFSEGPYSSSVIQMLEQKPLSKRWEEAKRITLSSEERNLLDNLIQTYSELPLKELELMSSTLYITRREEATDGSTASTVEGEEYSSTTLIRADNVNDLYVRLLSTIQDRGIDVDAVKDPLSVTTGFGQRSTSSRELIESTAILTDPRARLLTCPVRPLDIFFAIGQFLWYVSGSNDSDFIGYYNPRASEFTEAKHRITGNAYGFRLSNLPEGRSQLNSVLERLANDPNSRRTFMPIHTPSDNTVITKEVPCPIGWSLVHRRGRLHTILKMRSSNASTLLPLNIFSFSMLGELCASHLGWKLGSFYMNAVSFHYLASNLESVRKVLSSELGPKFRMSPMPPSSNFESIRLLQEYEQALRYDVVTEPDSLSIDRWNKRIERLGSYWSDIGKVLLCLATLKVHRPDVAMEICTNLDPGLAHLVKLNIAQRPLTEWSNLSSQTKSLRIRENQ